MNQLEALRATTSLKGVAGLLGFTASGLAYVIHVVPPAARYNKFSIPKKTGGTREIAAPIPQLKLAQRRLADILQNCMAIVNEASAFPDTISHGFKRKRSIITNARIHRGRRYVFNLDLKDFFGSINFGRVRGFFISDKRFALNEKVATILAQIACHEGALPQGSPCSPVVSNLIGHILDIHLVRLAKSAGCSYSRYADDLTFSTNLMQFPASIAQQVSHAPHTWEPGTALVKLITKSGFTINPDKVRMQYRDSRQEVTSLVVNRKVNIRSEYRRRVRAMVHKLFTTGSFEFVHTTTLAGGAPSVTKSKGTVKQLHGMLGFIDDVDTYRERRPGINQQLPRKKEVKLSSKELMYRRFLMFKEFYNAVAPVIVCEGNSDNVYLLHAIRALASKYPQLATIKADGQVKLNVRLFKYSGRSTGRILGITGGAAPLGQLAVAYASETKRFTAHGMHFPFILLIDNDSAAGPIYNIVNQITGQKPKGTEPFVPIAANLYLAATPLVPPAKSSCIEDCFDAKTKAFPLGAKTFNLESEFDTATHYGKMAFAEKVVAEHAAHIDFNGFAPLLSNIASAIDFHVAKFPLPAMAIPKGGVAKP